MELIRILLVVVGCIGVCHGYPMGAPAVACVHMTPGHVLNFNASDPLSPREDTSPFTVTVDKTDFEQGEKIQVTITGTENFGGFLLQARQNGEDEPVGAFSGIEPGAKMQFRECSAEYPEAAVTHRMGFGEDVVTLTWTAPNEEIADVTFYATVAQDHDNYWTKLESEKVAYNSGPTDTVPVKTTEKSGVKVLSPIVCMILVPVAALLVNVL